MMPQASSAPRKAARGITSHRPGSSTAATRTKRPLPALTPMMLGPARGFISTAWSTAPLTARADPAIRAAATRGSRT